MSKIKYVEAVGGCSIADESLKIVRESLDARLHTILTDVW